jgi:hypothetical protein
VASLNQKHFYTIIKKIKQNISNTKQQFAVAASGGLTGVSPSLASSASTLASLQAHQQQAAIHAMQTASSPGAAAAAAALYAQQLQVCGIIIVRMYVFVYGERERRSVSVIECVRTLAKPSISECRQCNRQSATLRRQCCRLSG